MTTSQINTAEAKEQFTELVNRVANNQERIILTRRGREIAAIVSIDDLKHLLAVQNQRDLEEAISALQEARTHGMLTLDDIR